MTLVDLEEVMVALARAAEDTIDTNGDRLVVENFLENFWEHLGMLPVGGNEDGDEVERL